MIFNWFFWKFLKVSLLISFLITFLFLITQMIRVDQILFNLPVKDSVSFLLLWFFYYFIYLLPLSLFIAFCISLFELKESKKLKILQAFGIDPKSIYIKSLFYTFPIIIALSIAYYLIGERDIAYLRNQLTLKYYTIIMTSIPPKSFHTFGQFTFYVEGKGDSALEGIFLKFQEGVIIAQKAYVKEEEIIFEKGSLLTQREGKTFSTDFDRYRLNLKMILADKEDKSKRSYVIGIVNVALSLFLMGLGYLLVNKIESHHRFYYSVGILSIVYQFLLFLLKQKF
ncbi:MAG: LptF/LptG family permease [Aquificaceae bacterium]